MSIRVTRLLLAHCGWMTGKPETIDSSVGLVPINALVFTDSIPLA